MTDHVVTEIADGVATVRFNRPDKKNAIHSGMYGEAASAIAAAGADGGVRVLVLTGTGDAFTAGNDLKDFLENPPIAHDAPVFRFMHALAEFPKPVIAAVNGVAVGIGTTVLLHCDFVYAVPGAKFQLPFVNLALVPEFASSLLLARFLGPRRAAELLMLGDAFDAEAALGFGLINAVVPAADLDATVRATAAALASKPPAALRATRELLNTDRDEIIKRIALEAKVFDERLKSDELKEAIAAFFEKRKPDFRKFS